MVDAWGQYIPIHKRRAHIHTHCVYTTYMSAATTVNHIHTHSHTQPKPTSMVPSDVSRPRASCTRLITDSRARASSAVVGSLERWLVVGHDDVSRVGESVDRSRRDGLRCIDSKSVPVACAHSQSVSVPFKSPYLRVLVKSRVGLS